jgi:hypothetical protein
MLVVEQMKKLIFKLLMSIMILSVGNCFANVKHSDSVNDFKKKCPVLLKI